MTHSAQASDETAPVDELYLPLAQDVQRSAPAKENVPERQSKQSESASWLVALVAASVRYVPAGHETQVADAVAAVAVL